VIPPRLVTSPGESYVDAMLVALDGASSFTLVTGFASASGVELLAAAIGRVLERGGQGRILVAVDRQGFNAAGVFRSLLGLRATHGNKLALGVALQTAGLLHAKALYTEGPTGPALLVGSANLTRTAYEKNHELGVVLESPPAELCRAFKRFVDSIAARSLDGPDAEGFLVSKGLLDAVSTPRQTRPEREERAESAQEVLAKLSPLAPRDVDGEGHLAAWIHRGYLVGRGRRGLDALVLRLPRESLVNHGYLHPSTKQDLGIASHETRTMSFGIDLIPTRDGEVLRRDARKVTLILAKLTLNLPCFGLWMPDVYWEVFLAARDRLQQAASLAPDHIHALAEKHRDYLTSGGLEEQLDVILDRLAETDLLVAGKRDAVREVVLTRFRKELALRTPTVLMNCAEFRTARQAWVPYELTSRPYRQLMVDIVQGTFAATYRSGDWPRMFRSHAARHLAESIARRLEKAGRAADGEMATAILEQASHWEQDDKPMTEAVEEFRGLVEDDIRFPVPDVEALAKGAVGSGADGGMGLEEAQEEDE
jgi:HKD family nuclease